MHTKRLVLVIAILAWPSLLSLASQAPESGGAPPPLPPARQIPGITAEDQFPLGCVDCHLNYTDMNMDTRISTLMAQWTESVPPALLAKAQAAAPEGLTLKGKHPDVSSMMGNIPKSCLTCHGKTSKTAPPFARMLHALHLTGGDQSPYTTIFQGECTHCHKLSAANGEWSIPSGPEK